MTGEAREAVVGGTVLVVLLLAMVLLQGDRDIAAEAANGGYPVEATFNRVDGLLPGADVRLGGVRVGVVESQRLDADFRAVVTMRIATATRLPLDSSAAIHTDGLFGDKYVVLEPGGEEEYLEPGDEITFTQDAVVISDLLELIISQGKMKQKKLKEQAAKGRE